MAKGRHDLSTSSINIVMLKLRFTGEIMLAFLGLDDTDSKSASSRGSRRGTGRVAREVAEKLVAEGYNLLWVTRHQLLKSNAKIHTPGRKSSKAITLLLGSSDNLRKAVEVTLSIVKDLSSPGSNAGVAVNRMNPPPT